MDPPGEPATHGVACYNCRAVFDAVEASWCNCIVARRTFTCPSCLKCFCKAPKTYKQGFWENAPQVLWDRVAAEHNLGFEAPALPEDAASATRPFVLIVDDEPDVQRLAVSAVQSLGYGVGLARDGEEGLALARRLRPDLVLSDAMMPKLDGREMCRRIKDDPDLPGVKVIIMTSLYTAPHYKYEAYREFRADGFLTKPLDFADLQKALREYLG